jgi:putative proteasome-type protease
MTYCVAINIEAGLVLLADTRTNAGVDNISRFKKMFTWEVPNERAIAVMTSGNLSITQGVISHIGSAIDRAEAGEEVETILNCHSLYRAAEMVGAAMREMQVEHHDSMTAQGINAGASIIVAGQRTGGRPRVFLIYAAGNFIEATRDTPFFQIGEHKYGKPILDRVIKAETSIEDAVKAALVSMDSTMRSNLSVGMPLDLAVIERDSFRFDTKRRIEVGDQNFSKLSGAWSDALRAAFADLPEFHL